MPLIDLDAIHADVEKQLPTVRLRGRELTLKQLEPDELRKVSEIKPETLSGESIRELAKSLVASPSDFDASGVNLNEAMALLGVAAANVGHRSQLVQKAIGNVFDAEFNKRHGSEG